MNQVFRPTAWSDEQITQAASAVGIELPEECLPGIKANLALLEDRWATVSAALNEIEA